MNPGSAPTDVRLASDAPNVPDGATSVATASAPSGLRRSMPKPAPSLAAEGDAAQAYWALSSLAIVGFVFGLASVLAALHWYFALVPLAGIVLSLWALRRIGRMPEELSGSRLAWAGLGLSAGFWALGSGWLVLAETASVPRGYLAVTFAELQPDPKEKGQLIPPKALELTGEDPQTATPRKVFIKGFMYPGRRTTGIREFLLVPTVGHCSFCSSQLRSTEVIRVRLVGDLTATFTRSQVAVGGKLEIDPAQALNPLGGVPYQIEADYLR